MELFLVYYRQLSFNQKLLSLPKNRVILLSPWCNFQALEFQSHFHKTVVCFVCWHVENITKILL